MSVAEHISAMNTVLQRARAGDIALSEVAGQLRRHVVQVMGTALRFGYNPTFAEMDRNFSEAVAAIETDPTLLNLAVLEVRFILYRAAAPEGGSP